MSKSVNNHEIVTQIRQFVHLYIFFRLELHEMYIYMNTPSESDRILIKMT
jgi:hypothetical protein